MIKHSTMAETSAQDAIVLLRKAAAQAKGVMHERRAALIEGYMACTKRCGFLWLKHRPLTEREIAQRIRESRHPLVSVFDAAWIHIDAARLDAERLSSTARGLQFCGDTILLSGEAIADVSRYLGRSFNPKDHGLTTRNIV